MSGIVRDIPELSQFHAVSEEELKKGNSQWQLKDPIPTTLLKECIDILLPILTSIVNRSLMNTEFPLAYKFAILVPLIKNDSEISVQCPM